jgi:hypothetical protein
LLERVQPVVYGLSRDAERLADVRGRGSQLTRLQDARGLQLVEVAAESAGRLERLEGEIRRLEMPDEPPPYWGRYIVADTSGARSPAWRLLQRGF